MQTPQQKRNRWLLSEISRYAATGLRLADWVLLVNVATRPQPVLVEDLLLPGAMTRHPETARQRLHRLQEKGLVQIDRVSVNQPNSVYVTLNLHIHITDLGRKLTGELSA